MSNAARGGLASGGFGCVNCVKKVVFKCEESKTEKTYVRRPAKCSEGLTYQLNLLGKIHDPHLVKYAPYKIIEQDPDILYIASEYCILGSLKEKLYYHHQMQQHPGEDLMDKYFVGIVRGLAFLHAHSPEIIHGRLKPSNVLFHGDDVDSPRLADFGLFWKGKSLLERKREDVMYYSPEIIDKMVEGSEGAELWGSTGADIWALGCILYELMSMGEPAFKGSTFEEISSLVKRGKYRRMNPIWSTTSIFKQMNRMFLEVKVRPPAKILMCEIKGDSMFCSKCKQMTKRSTSKAGSPPPQKKGKECESKTPPLWSTGHPVNSARSGEEKDMIIVAEKSASDNDKGGNAGVGADHNGEKPASDNDEAKVVAKEQPLYNGRRFSRDEEVRTEITSDPLTSTCKLLSPSLPQPPCSSTTPNAQSLESRASSGKSQSPESTPRCRVSPNPRASTSWRAPNTSDEKPPEVAPPSESTRRPESPPTLYPRQAYPGDIDPRFEFTPNRNVKPSSFWLPEDEKAEEEGDKEGEPKKSENYDNGRHQVDKMPHIPNEENLRSIAEDKVGREACEGGGAAAGVGVGVEVGGGGRDISRCSASHYPGPSQGGNHYRRIAPTGSSSLSTTMEQACSSPQSHNAAASLAIPLEREEGIVGKLTHGAAPCVSTPTHTTRASIGATSFFPINLDSSSPPPRAQKISPAHNNSESPLRLSPVNSSFSSLHSPRQTLHSSSTGTKFLFPHAHIEVGGKDRPLPLPKEATPSPEHYGKNTPPSPPAAAEPVRPHEKKMNIPGPPPPPAGLPPSQNPSMSFSSSSGRSDHSPLPPPHISRHPAQTSEEKPLPRETDFIFLQPASKGQSAQKRTEGEAQPSCNLDGARQRPCLGAVPPTTTSAGSASAASTYLHTLLGSPHPPAREPALTSPLFQTTPQARARRHENDATQTTTSTTKATAAPPSHHAPRTGAQRQENDAAPTTASAAAAPSPRDVARVRLMPEVPPLDLTPLLAPSRLSKFRPPYIHTSTTSINSSNWAAPTPCMGESRWAAPTPCMRESRWATPTPCMRESRWAAPTPCMRESRWAAPTPSMVAPSTPAHFLGDDEFESDDNESSPAGASSLLPPKSPSSYYGGISKNTHVRPRRNHFSTDRSSRPLEAGELVEHQWYGISSSFKTPALLGSPRRHFGDDGERVGRRAPVKLSPYHFTKNDTPSSFQASSTLDSDATLLALRSPGGGWANTSSAMPTNGGSVTPTAEWETRGGGHVALARSFGEMTRPITPIERVEPASVSPAPRYDASKRSPILPYRENGINKTMSSSTSAPPYQRAAKDSYSHNAAKNDALSAKFKVIRTALDTLFREVGKLRRYNASPPPPAAAHAPALGPEKKYDDHVVYNVPPRGALVCAARRPRILSEGREQQESPILPSSISPSRSPFPTSRHDEWSSSMSDTALRSFSTPSRFRGSTCTRPLAFTQASESIGIGPNHPQIYTHRWGTDRPPLLGRANNNTAHCPSRSRSNSRDLRPISREETPDERGQRKEEGRSAWWHIGGRYLAASRSLPGRYGAQSRRPFYSESANTRGFSTPPRPLTDSGPSPFCASSRSASPARTCSFSPQVDAYTSRNTHRAPSTILTCLEPMRFSESMIRKHRLSVRPSHPTSTQSVHTRAWANIGNSSSYNNNNNNFMEASQPLISSRSQPPTLNDILQSVDRKINRIMQNPLPPSSNYDSLKISTESQGWYDSASMMMSPSTSASTFGSSSGSSFGAHLSPHISSHGWSEVNRYSTRGRAKSHQGDKKKVHFPTRAGDLAETTEYITKA